MKLIKSFLMMLLLMGVISVTPPQYVYAEEEQATEEAMEDEEEVEIYSGVITAKSCAEKAQETGEFEILANCPPIEAAKSGYVIYDVTENEFYVPKLGKIYLYELDEGFGGSIDITGVIVGKTKDGISIIDPEEYEITPKPKPGFFKGCL